MELDALAELLGKQQAQNVIATNGKYFYKWIYSTPYYFITRLLIIKLFNESKDKDNIEYMGGVFFSFEVIYFFEYLFKF